MTQSPTTTQRFAARLGRFTLIYALGAGGVLVVSLVQAVAITHFLTPSEFGRLAVLMAFAGGFTLLPMLVTLQGTMGRVFGSKGDDDVPDVPDEAGEEDLGQDPGLALMTGTIVMCVACVLLVIIAWPFAADFSRALFGKVDYTREVRLAIIAGVLAAPFRLFLMFPRYGRRGMRYVAVELARLVIIIAAVIPFLIAGQGVPGAIGGFAIGEAVALLGAIFLTRKDLVFEFSLSEARQIFRVGIVMAPVLIAHYLIFNADIFVLNAFATEADVGEYRLAGTFGQFIAQPVSIFLLAWGPMARSPLHHAAQSERTPAVLGAAVLRYAWVAGIGLLVFTVLYADRIVALSPETYHGASTLVPLLGLGFVLRALFVILYRNSLIDWRRGLFVVLNAAAALIFIAALFILVPGSDAVGAAVSRIIAYGLVFTIFLVITQSRKPIPLAWGHLASAVVVGVLSYEVGAAVSNWIGAGALIGPLLYVALVIGTGIVPRSDVALVRRAALGLRARRPTQEIEERLALLPVAHLHLLRQVFREDSLEDGNSDSVSPEVEAKLAAALSEAAGLEGSDSIEPRTIPYALTYNRVAHHDRVGARLRLDGVDPIALDAIDETIRAIKLVPRRRWPTGAAVDGAEQAFPGMSAG